MILFVSVLLDNTLDAIFYVVLPEVHKIEPQINVDGSGNYTISEALLNINGGEFTFDEGLVDNNLGSALYAMPHIQGTYTAQGKGFSDFLGENFNQVGKGFSYFLDNGVDLGWTPSMQNDGTLSLSNIGGRLRGDYDDWSLNKTLNGIWSLDSSLFDADNARWLLSGITGDGTSAPEYALSLGELTSNYFQGISGTSINQYLGNEFQTTAIPEPATTVGLLGIATLDDTLVDTLITDYWTPLNYPLPEHVDGSIVLESLEMDWSDPSRYRSFLLDARGNVWSARRWESGESLTHGLVAGQGPVKAAEEAAGSFDLEAGEAFYVLILDEETGYVYFPLAEQQPVVLSAEAPSASFVLSSLGAVIGSPNSDGDEILWDRFGQLTDYEEELLGSDLLDPRSPAFDLDGDGESAFDELNAGTDPEDFLSSQREFTGSVRATGSARVGTEVRFSWSLEAGNTYHLIESDGLKRWRHLETWQPTIQEIRESTLQPTPENPGFHAVIHE